MTAWANLISYCSVDFETVNKYCPFYDIYVDLHSNDFEIPKWFVENMIKIAGEMVPG